MGRGSVGRGSRSSVGRGSVVGGDYSFGLVLGEMGRGR